MADILIKRKKEYVLEGKYEIEINGEIETRDIKITKALLLKAKDMFDNKEYADMINFIKYEFLQLGDVQVDDDELISEFTGTM
jgi:hypothetical protein